MYYRTLIRGSKPFSVLVALSPIIAMIAILMFYMLLPDSAFAAPEVKAEQEVRIAPVPAGNNGGPIMIFNDPSISKAREDIFEFRPDKMKPEEREQHHQWAREAIQLLASYGTSAFPEESIGQYVHDGFGGYLFFVGPPSYELFVIDINPKKETRRMKPVGSEYNKLISEFKDKYDKYYQLF